MKVPSGNPLGINLGFRIGAGALIPILKLITKRTWLHSEKVPKSGAVIFYSNHVSYLDAFVFAHYLFANGRAPRFIGKEVVFRIPIFGWILQKAEQIPVKRESNSASIALSEAINALQMGHAIGIYPEGTLTRDPNLWPMSGKTGAVRLALAAGAPLIPVAQWGSHKILAPYSKFLRFFPPKPITLMCADPIDLSKWQGKEDDVLAMEEATNYAMRVLADLVGQLRNESAPSQLFDLRKSDLPKTGNFRKNKRP
jgi:1-acyl-sn-glycerol-3-phosphate acyltransferase